MSRSVRGWAMLPGGIVERPDLQVDERVAAYGLTDPDFEPGGREWVGPLYKAIAAVEPPPRFVALDLRAVRRPSAWLIEGGEALGRQLSHFPCRLAAIVPDFEWRRVLCPGGFLSFSYTMIPQRRLESSLKTLESLGCGRTCFATRSFF